MYDPTEGWTETRLRDHVCEIFEPDPGADANFVLLFLHDEARRSLRSYPGLSERVRATGLPVIAPQTGPSWWTDRICDAFDVDESPERFVLEDVLPFIGRRWKAQPPRIALLGVGMGGQGALRLAYKYPDTFPVVSAISPAVDFQLLFDGRDELQQMYADPEAVRQETATLYIHPLNWPRNQFFCCDPEDELWWDGVDRLRMKLASLGVPHECDLETSGAESPTDYVTRMADPAVEFVVSRLEKELLRLPLQPPL
jgi:pimeloyl-ACP methyl ester carboxylesterase